MRTWAPDCRMLDHFRAHPLSTAQVDAAFEMSGPRPLIFSSFDPDICLELKRRRPAFHVYFLSGGGEYSHADQRRTSVAAAIQVADSGGLQVRNPS